MGFALRRGFQSKSIKAFLWFLDFVKYFCFLVVQPALAKIDDQGIDIVEKRVLSDISRPGVRSDLVKAPLDLHCYRLQRKELE